MTKLAKERARHRVNTIEFEYRRRYNLPETDDRFLDMTIEDMLTDIWAHRFHEDPKALEDAVDEDFDVNNVAAELGYAPVDDDDMPDDFEDV